MASKLAAARMASWSGVRTVIAAADRPEVLAEAIAGISGIGTAVPARETRAAARKLWIGFAVAPHGQVTIDDGAAEALSRSGGSLLIPGITRTEGTYSQSDAVEIMTLAGEVFAKGLVAFDSDTMDKWKGSRAEEGQRASPLWPSTAMIWSFSTSPKKRDLLGTGIGENRKVACQSDRSR